MQPYSRLNTAFMLFTCYYCGVDSEIYTYMTFTGVIPHDENTYALIDYMNYSDSITITFQCKILEYTYTEFGINILLLYILLL